MIRVRAYRLMAGASPVNSPPFTLNLYLNRTLTLEFERGGKSKSKSRIPLYPTPSASSIIARLSEG
jgi:hypothetical protein